jgi:apolipoprotein D and lipocalin family protein
VEACVRTTVLAAIAAFSLTVPAGAAPIPTRPADLQFFTGRWFEIARLNNPRQKECQAPTYDFMPQASGNPRFTLTCRKGSPSGPAEHLNAIIRLPKGQDAAQFRVNVLGGLVGANYTILDHDDAYSWAVLTVNDGRYVWLLARRNVLEPQLVSRLTSRIASLGYNTRDLVFPRW